MSRKHYVEIAKVIRTEVDVARSLATPSARVIVLALKVVAIELASMFKRDNSAFDRTRFMDACGLGDN